CAQTILQKATANPDLATLVSLASQFPAIVGVLNGTEQITVFAPTNAAFVKLKTEFPALYAAVTADAKLLAGVLSYHVVNGIFDPKTAAPYSFVKTYQGGILRAVVSGSDISLGFGSFTSKVASTVPASNGVIHVIDSVLMPPAGALAMLVGRVKSRLGDVITKINFAKVIDTLKDVTIFAPQDTAFEEFDDYVSKNKIAITPAILSAILDSHIFKGIIYSTNITTTPIKGVSAFNGRTADIYLNGSTIMVKGGGNTVPVVVSQVDNLIDVGVVHIVESLILPANFAEIPAGPDVLGIYLPSFDPITTTDGKPYTPGTDGKPNTPTTSDKPSLPNDYKPYTSQASTNDNADKDTGSYIKDDQIVSGSNPSAMLASAGVAIAAAVAAVLPVF
ncbi:FAS1 domain-containing protein, partial [Entophlyctis helioformis]